VHAVARQLRRLEFSVGRHKRQHLRACRGSAQGTGGAACGAGGVGERCVGGGPGRGSPGGSNVRASLTRTRTARTTPS
jgi:hypothetical protein